MAAIFERLDYVSSAGSPQSQQTVDLCWEYPVAPRRRSIRSKSAAVQRGTFLIEHRGKHWAVVDAARRLVCLTVYKRGAEEVVRRLEERS